MNKEDQNRVMLWLCLMSAAFGLWQFQILAALFMFSAGFLLVGLVDLVIRAIQKDEK